MRILLAKCPRSYQSHFEENSESLALGYLASVLRKNGFLVDILDASLMGLSVENAVSRITSEDYDLIGFTIADPSYIVSTFDVVNRIRGRHTSTHITIGGYAPTFNYREVLEICSGIDSVTRYEGEEIIIELAKAIRDQTDWHVIPNLAHRHNDIIVANPSRPLIRDLDSLPFPARDNLPYILRYKKDTGVVSISGSRGCYANCEFCSIRSFYGGVQGSTWRARSVKNIVDEIGSLVRLWRVKEVVFVDDVFIGPGKAGIERTLRFADEIKRRNLRIMLSITDARTIFLTIYLRDYTKLEFAKS